MNVEVRSAAELAQFRARSGISLPGPVARMARKESSMGRHHGYEMRDGEPYKFYTMRPPGQ